MEEHDVLLEGDTVRMAIGGPLMTVLSVKAGHCCCFWFDEQGRLVHGDFEREVLRFVRPAERLIPHAEAFWRRRRAVLRVASNGKPAPVRSPRPMLAGLS